jgi:hypothetical protein
MGTSYAEQPIIPAPAEVPAVGRQVALEAPEPAMAMEENVITELRRSAFREYAPVLSADDPVVRQASFRGRFEAMRSDAERRERARHLAEADILVSTRPTPLISSPELDRVEKRTARLEYQSIVPIQRKAALS